jgi:hypothetical protein
LVPPGSSLAQSTFLARTVKNLFSPNLCESAKRDFSGWVFDFLALVNGQNGQLAASSMTDKATKDGEEWSKRTSPDRF